MEKDKLDLIKKIITLVDTKEGLKKVENAVDEVLRTQWDKEAKDRKEFEQWRKDRNGNSDSIVDLPL
jgi:conjugal transfer/entry exclusion protein